MTSKNIMLIDDNSERDFKPYIIFKAQCACQHEHDIHTITLEFDDEGVKEGFLPHIVMELYANVSYCEDWKTTMKLSWYEKIWWDGKFLLRKNKRRIRDSLKLLFTGWVEQEASFLFGDEKSINDYIKALNEGLENEEGKNSSRKSNKGEEKWIVHFLMKK